MPPISSSMLMQNLSALAVADADLARRLRMGMAGDHVKRAADGTLTVSAGAEDRRLGLTPREIQVAFQRIVRPSSLVVLGIGAGELVDAALRLWPSLRVFAWDLDPWMLRMLLSRRDLSMFLSTGQLRLGFGTDLLDLPPDASVPTLRHPLLAPRYARELQVWSERRTGPFVCMATAGLFVDDLADAWWERGLAPWRVDVSRLDRQEVLHQIHRLQPAFAVAVNQVVGLPETMDALGIPLLTWEVDPATDHLPTPARAVPRSHLFTFRKQHEQALANVGHGSVTWLPLAAPAHRCPVAYTEQEREEYAVNVSFVGTSMVALAQSYARAVVQDVRSYWAACGRADGKPAEVIGSILDEQRATLDEWRIPALVETHLPGFLSWCSRTQKKHDPCILMSELPAAERRLRCVAALAPFGVDVWGDPGWQAIARPGVRLRGFAGHKHALTRIYGLSRVNVDIGRLYQSDIVTMRVFDVLACGGFLIAEHSAELPTLFSIGVEVESWSTLPELVDKVAYYLQHPEKAAAIARRGHAAVNARHRLSIRVDTMLEVAGLPLWTRQPAEARPGS